MLSLELSTMSSSQAITPSGSPVHARSDILGLRSIPSRIRALAMAIHSDSQFEELQMNGKYTISAALKILSEMGESLTNEELITFEMALTEFDHQLKGVNLSLVKRELVSQVLSLTSSIDGEASYAGISIAANMDSVVLAHALFLEYINMTLPRKAMELFDRFANAVIARLRVLERIIKVIAGRRGSKFKIGEIQESQIANGELRAIISSMKPWAAMALDAEIFDSKLVIKDQAAEVAWNAAVGKNQPAARIPMFVEMCCGFPPSVVQALIKHLDFDNLGWITIQDFADAVCVWGPFTLMAQNVFMDLRTGAFILGACRERIALHMRGVAHLFDISRTGDRMKSRDMLSVAGSITADRLRNSFDPNLEALPGNFAVGRSATSGVEWTLHLIAGDGSLKNFQIHRIHGAWQVHGFSKALFESVHDAISSYRDTFVRAVGCDEDVVWHNGVLSIPDSTSHALHRACFCGNAVFVAYLLQNGNDTLINVSMTDEMLVSTDFMWTPLMFAVNTSVGDPVELVDMLIAYGAEVTFIDAAGCTALYYAIALGYAATVRSLLRADPSLISSLTTDRMLMSLGAHHFLAEEADVRRLSDAPLSSDVIAELLKYEDDEEFVWLCAGIIEGKRTRKPLLPDRSVYYTLGVNLGRLSHFANSSIVTEELQREIDRLVDVHTERCKADGSLPFATRAIQNRLFVLSVRRHLSKDLPLWREQQETLHQPQLMFAFSLTGDKAATPDDSEDATSSDKSVEKPQAECLLSAPDLVTRRRRYSVMSQ